MFSSVDSVVKETYPLNAECLLERACEGEIVRAVSEECVTG